MAEREDAEWMDAPLGPLCEDITKEPLPSLGEIKDSLPAELKSQREGLEACMQAWFLERQQHEGEAIRLQTALDCGKETDCADEVETQEQCQKHYAIYMERQLEEARRRGDGYKGESETSFARARRAETALEGAERERDRARQSYLNEKATRERECVASSHTRNRLRGAQTQANHYKALAERCGEVLPIIVFALRYDDFGDEDWITWERCVRRWEETWKPALQEEHFGDCTKQPQACFRCQAEDCVRLAKRLAKELS